MVCRLWAVVLASPVFLVGMRNPLDIRPKPDASPPDETISTRGMVLERGIRSRAIELRLDRSSYLYLLPQG